ncbi:MAG: carbon-nitrogen hydrolase family protein [Chloroflexota bacterium]
MSRAIGVVAAQVAPVVLDPAATFDKFEREVRTLATRAPNLDLYVFPELYLSAIGSWDTDYPAGYVRSVASLVPGPLTDRIGSLAREVGKWIVAGSIMELAGDRIHNTAVAFDPAGTLVARHRKLLPWKPFESSDPGPGEGSLGTFDIPGVGRFGLMICYEGWFPEIPRALAWRGAEVILQPTLTTTSDRPLEAILVRANAIANQCYVLNPNYGAMFGTGRSLIVDPEGAILAEGGSGEEFLTAVLDLDRVRSVREYGTSGLNTPWKQLRDMPPPAFPQYVEGWTAGAVMDGLGPLGGVADDMRPARPRVATTGRA